MTVLFGIVLTWASVHVQYRILQGKEARLTPMEKAAVIDKHAEIVREKLLEHLTELVDITSFSGNGGTTTAIGEASDKWNEVLQVARARHILGHYEYGDSNLFEWSDGKVRAAIIEELADAVVYQAWLEERASNDQ